MAAARTGARFSLAIRLDDNGPQLGNIPGRINPLHVMVGINTPYSGDPADFCASDDAMTLGLQACTHWDALAHVSYEGKLYNGFDAADDHRRAGRGPLRHPPDPARREPRRSCSTWPAPSATTPCSRPRHLISEADLEAAVELAGVRPEPGDVVLVRTGQMTHLKARDRQTLHLRRPARASPPAPSGGCAATTSPRWPPTRWPWRCTPARTPRCSSRCT